MNKAEKLFDEKFVKFFFKENLLPLYPDFVEIRDIKIRIHKKHLWTETYHLVVSYDTALVDRGGQVKVLPIFCSAHSEEPRENVYKVLKFLWEAGFNRDNLSIPHPLFFSEYFNGVFYRGAEGTNLYHYIRTGDIKKIEEVVPRAAQWFAKLHNLSTKGAINFNKLNSRIKTVIPGRDHIITRIGKDYPAYLNIFKSAYNTFIKNEEQFLNSTTERWLVHGDAHPENIIRMSKAKLAVIDFTDLCLSDFARDIGAFLQQVEYMSNRKINDPAYAEKIKKIFLDNYFRYSKIKLNEKIQARIRNYYLWTATRTATHFLIKDNPEPERVFPLVEKVRRELNIC